MKDETNNEFLAASNEDFPLMDDSGFPWATSNFVLPTAVCIR